MSGIYYEDFRERECPFCKKNFIVPPHNVYKERIAGTLTNFCSWKCLCAYRRQKTAPERKSTIPMPVIKRDKSGRTVKEYNSIAEAAREGNISYGYIKTRLEGGLYDERNKCYWGYKFEKGGSK